MKRTAIAISSFALALACYGTAHATEDAGATAGATAGPVPGWVTDAGPEAAPSELEAPVVDVEADPVGAAERLIGHIKAGEWRLVASLILAFLMFGLAKVRDRVPWFRGDRGGAILVMVLALGGSMAAALASEVALDWRLFLGAVGVAWTAAGGYTWFRRLIWPKDKGADGVGTSP